MFHSIIKFTIGNSRKHSIQNVVITTITISPSLIIITERKLDEEESLIRKLDEKGSTKLIKNNKTIK